MSFGPRKNRYLLVILLFGFLGVAGMFVNYVNVGNSLAYPTVVADVPVNSTDTDAPVKHFDSTDFVLATNHHGKEPPRQISQNVEIKSQNTNNPDAKSDTATNNSANSETQVKDVSLNSATTVNSEGFTRSTFFGGNFIGGGASKKKHHSNDTPPSNDQPKNDPPVNADPPSNTPPSQDVPKNDPPVSDNPPTVNPPVNNDPPGTVNPPVVDNPPSQDDPPYYPPVIDEPPHSDPVSVPEPSTIPLMLAGMAGIYFVHRRRRTA